MDTASPAQKISISRSSSSPEQSASVRKFDLATKDAQSRSNETKIAGSSAIDVEIPSKKATKHSSISRCRGNRTASKSTERKYMLRSLVGSGRVLRSRSRGIPKAPDLVNNVENDSAPRASRGKKKKNRQKTLNNDYLRTRRRIRYLLNRMSYQQSFISAYSGEGWKGQNLEKLKPDKELQSATSEISRCKLKIRDLFRYLDSLCVEGRLQESLFDSEGLICSEDIFCAKCGSKDLSTDNDIILCDGICDRGFHQMCLEPPLFKEDIPPGDEGWLCPGCDCKVDCVDLLNDFQGTDLSLDDSWEKVFPEAAAAGGGSGQDDFGFPSDDSEDNDYDPDGQEVDEKNQTEGSSSEESELNHASDDLVTSPHNEQYLGLPSDDSEDNDYDPNAPDLDEQVKEETSSSDFTSDSEGFSVGRDDSTPLNKDYSPVSLLVDSSGSSERYTLENEKQTQTELQSISESDLNQENVTPVSGRRNKERLDYKKLHDEAYGNVSSDSSDDEDWNETDAPRKRKTSLGKDAVIPQEEKFINITNGTNTAGINQDLKEADNTQKRITPQKLKVEDENNSRSETHKINPETRSAEKNSTSPRTPPARSLGKAVTQRLSKSLRENEYPARATKENLAKELGITFRQVSKWFENARRSLRQSACMSEHGADTASPMGTAVIQMNGKFHELESKTDTGCNRVLNWESSKGDISNCATTGRKFEIGETSRQQSATPKSTKKRIRTSDENSHEDLSRKKTPPKGAPVNSPQSQALRRSSRISKQEESCPDVEMRTGRAVH